PSAFPFSQMHGQGFRLLFVGTGVAVRMGPFWGKPSTQSDHVLPNRDDLGPATGSRWWSNGPPPRLGTAVRWLRHAVPEEPEKVNTISTPPCPRSLLPSSPRRFTFPTLVRRDSSSASGFSLSESPHD